MPDETALDELRKLVRELRGQKHCGYEEAAAHEATIECADALAPLIERLAEEQDKLLREARLEGAHRAGACFPRQDCRFYEEYLDELSAAAPPSRTVSRLTRRRNERPREC